MVSNSCLMLFITIMAFTITFSFFELSTAIPSYLSQGPGAVVEPIPIPAAPISPNLPGSETTSDPSEAGRHRIPLPICYGKKVTVCCQEQVPKLPTFGSDPPIPFPVVKGCISCMSFMSHFKLSRTA